MDTTYTVDPDITTAATLPGTFYCDAAVFALARRRVFGRSWQWLGDVADIALPGSLSPRDMLPGLLDEPLLLARDAAGVLRCLSNVCTHRGNVLVGAPCRAEQIHCGYHGRRFDLTGHMSFMPGFEGVKNFPSAADDLPQVPLGLFGPHAFAAVDPVAPLDAFIGEMRERTGWMPLEHFSHDPSLDRDYHVAAHWALYVENCLDGFHLPFEHPDAERLTNADARVCELYRYACMQRVAARTADAAFDLPPGSPDEGQRIAAYCYWIFPNLMLDFYPWGLSLNVVLPLGPGRTRVARRAYLWPERKPLPAFSGAHEQAEMEAEALIEQVQNGMRSHGYRGGRYSPTYERAVHHFHRLMCEFMASD